MGKLLCRDSRRGVEILASEERERERALGSKVLTETACLYGRYLPNYLVKSNETYPDILHRIIYLFMYVVFVFLVFVLCSARRLLFISILPTS